MFALTIENVTRAHKDNGTIVAAEDYWDARDAWNAASSFTRPLQYDAGYMHAMADHGQTYERLLVEGKGNKSYRVSVTSKPE